MKRVLTFIVLVGLLVPTAQAAFILRLTDIGTATSVTIPDGGALDDNAAAGVIVFNSGIAGTTWVVNVTTGLSKPLLPPIHMDLNSVNVTSSGPAQLLIELTDTDFVLPAGGASAVLLSEIGGTTHEGLVEFDQYLDRGNAEFGYGDYVVSQGPFGPGAFSGTASTATPVLDGVPFSITEWVLITHTGAGVHTTSFDASSTVVPVPGAVLLGMLGLSAAGIKLRRRV